MISGSIKMLVGRKECTDFIKKSKTCIFVISIIAMLLLISFVSADTVMTGMEAIDITLVGGYDTAGNAVGISMVGNYIYVADGSNGLVIVDVKDLTKPMLSGHYRTENARNVFGSDNYVYVADGNDGLVIVDVSNPTTPTLVGRYDTAGDAYAVFVLGNYAYVADGNNGLVILGVSNPAEPTFVGRYDISGERTGDVFVSGNYAYVAGGGKGLVIVDVSNPAIPTLVGSYDTGHAEGVIISGNYAYVADGGNGLVIVDINNPATPTFSGRYNYDTAINAQDIGNACGILISGNHIYLASGGKGLVIIDVNNPAAPVFAGRYDTGNACGVFVSSNNVYVADLNNGFLILSTSISTPAPTEASSIIKDGDGIWDSKDSNPFVEKKDETPPASSSIPPEYLYGGAGLAVIFLLFVAIIRRKPKQNATTVQATNPHTEPKQPELKPVVQRAPVSTKNIDVKTAFGYKGATIQYKIKVENPTSEPIGDIKVNLYVPDVFLVSESTKTIVMLKPGEGKTVTFEIRPTGECGDCEVSGKVIYYDYSTKKTSDIEIPARSLSIVCPMLRGMEISESEWHDVVSNFVETEESTRDIDMPAETLFTMVSRIVKDMHMHPLNPEITNSPQLYNGVARFYGEGVKGLKYAAQVEVVGGAKKSKLILKTWAEKEEALTGFYHGLLDELEKRVHVKGYIDDSIVQNVYHYGDNIGTQVKDSLVQRSNIGTGVDVKKCPNCGRDVDANEKFCLECGTKL